MRAQRTVGAGLVVLTLVVVGCQRASVGSGGGATESPFSTPGLTAKEAAIDAEVVAAWKAAEAKFGWLYPWAGTMQFTYERPVQPILIPTFSMYAGALARLKDLPAPQVPFGLDLGSSWTEADLKVLVRFKHLRALTLRASELTDAGLKELAALIED